MNVFVKVYKIENGNIAGGKTIDEIPLLEVSDFGEVKEYLEEDATEFRMDSISLKTEFLPKGYFDDYTPQKPYLVEVQVGEGWDATDENGDPASRCVFYGPIKKKSIKYNERTGVTFFEGSSWDRSIKQAQRMVSRTRTPVKVAKAYRRDGKGGGKSVMSVVGTDPDIDTEIQPGTVLKTSGKIGEKSLDFHFISTETPTPNGTVDGEQVYDFEVINGADDLLSQGPVSGVDFLWQILEGNPPGNRRSSVVARWTFHPKALGVPVDDVNSTPEGAVGATFTFKINGTEHQSRVEDAFTGPKLQGPEDKIADLDTSEVDRGEYFWFVLSDRLDFDFNFAPPKASYGYREGGEPATDWSDDPLHGTYEDAEWTISKRMKIEQGEDGTLLSDDAYGVGEKTVSNYDPVALAEGIATRTPALADLLGASPIVRGNPGEISRMYEFPEKGIKALGEIQRSSQSIMSFEARSADGAGSERKGGGARRVRLLVRTREHMANQSAVALPDTIEWKGEALGVQPDVVLVKGPKPINITSERDEAYGWYPKDEIENPDQASSQGKEFTEIEIPLAPAVVQAEGAFSLPENVPALSGRAKRYFNFYSQYYKEKEVVVDGVFDTVESSDIEETVLGRVVSEDDSVIESGIVKSQSVDYQAEKTTLTVWVSESYTAPPNEAPVALINAPTILEGSEAVEVTIDAAASYDPDGVELGYEWSKNGSVISGETGRYLSTSVSNGDTISLTVEDSRGDTDTASETFTVIPEDEFPSDPGDEPDFTVSLNEDASDPGKTVFEIQAWKKKADLEVNYRIEDGSTVVDSGVAKTGTGAVDSTFEVDRVENAEGNDYLVTLWVTDTTNDVVSGEKSRRVYEGSLPEFLNVKVDPTNRGGGSVVIFVDLDSDANEWDLEWRVEDGDGNLVGEDTISGISSDTKQFYIDSPPEGGSGYIKTTPKSYVRQDLIEGPTHTIVIGPPEDSNTRFNVFGENSGSTSLSDPNDTLSIESNPTEGGVEYEVSLPQKVGPNDDPGFNTVGFGSATAGTDESGVAELKNDDGSYAPLHVSRLITEDGGGIAGDLKSVATQVVQARASIRGLDAVTARKSRKIESGPNVQQVGTLEDASVSLVPKPTFDQVILNNQTGATDEAVRADRSFDAGGNVNSIGDLTEDRTVSLVNQPTFKQVTLNEQANATNEAVRADRTVEVEGTDNQISVNAVQTTQGDLTNNVSVTLQTPQNIHEGADFRIDQLRVGTDNSPGTTGGAHINATIQHPEWDKGLEHWGMTPSGELDARLIEVDELIAKAFTADITQSLAGSDVLTLSAADLASDFNVPSPSDGYVTGALHIENVGEAGAQAAFRDGDTIRLRIIDRSGGGLKVLDVWGTVRNYNDQEDGTQKWDFETASGTRSQAYGSKINKGSRVLDYGKSGDTIIQRTVLGSLSPYDRAVQWYDNDNDGVPDSYDILTQTGNIAGVGDVDSGLSKPGYYGSVARFTDDVVVGDLDAARSGSDGTYIKFTESNGIEIVVGSGDVETQINTNASAISNNESSIAQNEDDLRLLAQRLMQEQEARAGMSLNVGENSAEIAIQTEILSSNGITANTNITSRVETVETDTESNTTAINNLESIVGDGQNLAKANLTLTAEQNTTDIETNSTAISSLESIVGDGNNLARADLTLTAVQNTGDIDANSTAISSLESIVGDGQNLAKADLTLTAEQNTSDIGTNSSAISSLGAQVGSGSIDAASTLTLAANQNTQQAEDNASAISTLESQVGTGEITAASSLTLAANQNTADLELLAKYITQESEARAGVETTVNENSAEIVLQAEILADNGITSSTNITQRVSNAEAEISLNATILDDNGLTSSTDINQRVTNNEAVISSNATILDNNGLTSSSDITQRVSDDEAIISSNATILDNNGLTSSSDITQRVTDTEAELDLTVRYDDSGAGVLVEANDTGTAITLDADTTLVGKLEGPNSEYTINLNTGDFSLRQGVIGGVDANTIRRGGSVFLEGFEGGIGDWVENSSAIIFEEDNYVWSGDKSAQFKSQNDTNSTSGGSTGGVHIAIPEEIALQFAGTKVEVTIYAKDLPQGGSGEFAVAYSTNDVGNSGWNTFSTSGNWERYSFTYEVPNPSSGGSDYLGILGDANGKGGATFIDRITIRPQLSSVGEIADLDEIKSTYIGNGEVVTRTVKANAIEANEINLDSFWAEDATVENTLTMGSSGTITNNASPKDFQMNNNGFEVNAQDAGSGANSFDIINFENDTTYGFLTGSSNTILLSAVNNTILKLSSDEKTRIQTSSGQFVEIISDYLQVNKIKGVGTDSPVQFHEGMKVGDSPVQFEWNEAQNGMVFREARSSQPSNSEMDSLLNPLEMFLYLVEDPNEGGSDVVLQLFEKKSDGTVAGPKRFGAD